MLAAVLAVISGLLCIALFAVWRSKTTIEAHAREDAKARAAAEATLAPMEQALSNSKDEIASLNHESDALRERLVSAEKNEALANQKLEGLEQRLKDFEMLKTQFEQYAKSAALETGNQLSNKLMADHVRAREETHKQFEQFTKLASEQLLTKQQELATTLGQVQGQMNDSKAQLSTLVRAMQNPIGAGAEGEIVMNNILQQHGFTPGVDYELQVHLATDEGNLRPDCVVYLPQQHAVIVDAKASQHIFALFRAEGTPEFDEAFREIQTSMRAHAKALGGKTYQDSLRKLKNHHGQPITRTTLVMFVPNDEVVTRLMNKDPNLMQYLRDHDIVLAGPVTLSGLFLTARALVREARQVDEQHAILEMVSALMGDVIMAVKHAEKIIGGIKSSASAFDQFSASMNRGLSRLRKIQGKGINPPKNVALPGNLPRYDISKADEVIQGEAEETAEILSLPKDAA